MQSSDVVVRVGNVPFVPVWQLDEDRQFPLYRQWTKVTKKNKVRFQRDSLPRHPVDWTNRETRRSKWYKKKFGSQ